MTSLPHFQEALEIVEKLPLDDQAALVKIVSQRLIDQGRAELVQDLKEAREAYQKGDVRRGSVADLLLLTVGKHDEVY